MSVSSDEVRGEHVKKYMETHPGVSNKDAFDKTGKTATQNFNKRVEQLIRESEKSHSCVHIIFIDKNHPPNGLDKTVGMIKQHLPVGCVSKKLYLIPKIYAPIKDYPFSAQFFLQCYYRLQKRDEHETLSNENPLLSTQVLFMFFKMFNRESFGDTFQTDYSLDGFLEVPLTVEDPVIQVPKEILSLIDEILKSTSKGSRPMNEFTIE